MTSKLRVGDVMTREVCSLRETDPLSIADDVMQLGRIRHLPVVNGEGELAGIVSQRDLFRGSLERCLGYGERAQRRVLDMLRLKEVMTRDVHTADEQDSLAEAAQTMIDRKVGCLVVVEGTTPVGILTEGDFVKLQTSG